MSQFKVGNIVWVNEPGHSHEIKKHDWYGKILKIHTVDTIANIKDINPNSSYYNSVYPRFIKYLELKEERRAA